MLSRIRNRHFFLLDLLLLTLAAYFSFVLRLEKFDISPFWASFVIFTLISIAIASLVFSQMGVYSRYWQYASIEELLLLTGSVTLVVINASLIGFVVLLFAPSLQPLPRSIPFIFLLLTLGATAGPRLALRTAALYRRPLFKHGLGKKTLIIGAGESGSMIAREVQKAPHLGMHPIGFIDDDLSKQGLYIRGIPVLGAREDIPRLAAEHQVEQVVIAMPTAPGKIIREILRICEDSQVQTKTIPGMYDLLDGTIDINQLRNIQIEDLLRREPIQTDITAVQKLLTGQRILITGGGGSIGSELCRQILQFSPSEIILLGHGENSIFEIYHELLRKGLGKTTITPVIADIRFGERILAIFKQYQPDAVFHAAAHKHVPLMELNPPEAITNNVLGTRNLLAAAKSVGVKRFVMISTDKAVNPTSVMGAAKRAAELLVHQASRQNNCAYMAVRFGNVLGSRGSVVLTFQKQIAAGGPITVTDPEMTRFFMTIPEAVQLVLQAAVLGYGGEVFLLDMGEPVKIVDLAHDLIELSGLEVGRDIDITFTGKRPGEKLFEELFVSGENYKKTKHQKIFIAENASQFIPDKLNDHIAQLSNAAANNDAEAVIDNLKALIPEYTPMRNL